jgi:hypothetical protein
MYRGISCIGQHALLKLDGLCRCENVCRVPTNEVQFKDKCLLFVLLPGVIPQAETGAEEQLNVYLTQKAFTKTGH